MSDKTFENSDLNKEYPDTIRNLAVSLGALLVVVVSGFLLYSIIADRFNDAATGPKLAIFPMEEAERYSAEHYAPVRVGSEPAAAGLVISPVEEAERFTPEWYAWHQGREEGTAPAKALASFPIEEAERFSSEWYQWYMNTATP